MALQSKWFRGNRRLEQCSLSDPYHVLQRDRGDYVALIQDALMALDGASISDGERRGKLYGESTARAVLAYKTKRRIVNPGYQKQADNIVGRMTIQSLDCEMLRKEAANRGRHPLLLSFSVAPQTISHTILSETHADWLKWAQQVQVGTGAQLITVSAKPTVAEAAAALKKAIAAVRGGYLVISVGHGYCPDQREPDSGVFDLAPGGVMRISGRQSTFDFATVYYDEPKPKPSNSIKVDDQRVVDGQIAGNKALQQKRLDNWKVYEEICAAFKSSDILCVFLLTCRVGLAHVMLQTVANQWQKPIAAYKDLAACQVQPSGRARVFMARDRFRENELGSTNDVFGEVGVPVPVDIAGFLPKPPSPPNPPKK